MSLLTVPLNANLSEKIEQMVKLGVAANKADFARRALEHYIEEIAVLAVLQSEQEAGEGKILSGDLDELTRKI